MRLGPFTITRTKALPPLRGLSPVVGGWWPVVRESYTGAWQQNVEVSLQSVATNPTLFACITLIAGDIAKLGLCLVEEDDDGIWHETSSPAFSPVLRKPNRYQTIVQFLEQWLFSKLSRGNTYVLKSRDQRGVVTALYVLDPLRVTPLVTPTGDVYYQISRDDLAEVGDGTITVPASEVIHDRMNAIFHPLIGMSPIFACGVAALQGLAIQNSSHQFFQTGANPSGILTAPGSIATATADRLAAYFNTNFSGNNAGKVVIVGDGLKYEQLSMSAVDSQLIDQLKWTSETICSTFHVPPYMVGIGPPPPYANVEPLLQQYLAQCIQILTTSLEDCLDEGLGIDQPLADGTQYGTEFDIDDLIWMDTATKTAAAKDGIMGGGLSPDEARQKYFGLGPVAGGDTPYMQEQNWPLRLLSQRELPSRAPTPPQALPADTTALTLAAMSPESLRKALAEGASA